MLTSFFLFAYLAGMSLALTSKRFLEIFRKSISGIFMTNKYRFGVGTDGNVRSITAVVGDNLDELRIEDSKYVADQTVRALIRYCPNLRVLDLLHTPSIGMYDLADLIKARCRSLESVSLRNGVYAGDAVLVALGKHCELLRVLVIQGTECEVTPGALMCALAGSAGTLRRVSVDNVFGRQLSLRAVLPPWGLPSTPVFRHLESFEVKNVSWVNGNDAYVLTKALIVHAPQLKELKISPDSRDLAVAVMSDEQIADLKASIPEFVATVWKNHDEPIVRMYYGFDPANSGSSNEGVPQEVLLGPGEAGPA